MAAHLTHQLASPRKADVELTEPTNDKRHPHINYSNLLGGIHTILFRPFRSQLNEHIDGGLHLFDTGPFER